jgi:biotin operon repressor
MPSREASLRNLAKARLRWRAPRPWRSRPESRLIRMITWQWLLNHGPWCSGRALARWLGVSHTYVQKLTQTLSRHESDFLREVAFRGIPTVEGLRRAREESRQQRERGLLRTQRRWKTVEYEIGHTVVRDVAPTKPNAATFVANNPFLADTPTPSTPGKLDYNAMYMWHLRMNAEREAATKPWRPARGIRWRPGMTRQR